MQLGRSDESDRGDRHNIGLVFRVLRLQADTERSNVWECVERVGLHRSGARSLRSQRQYHDEYAVRGGGLCRDGLQRLARYCLEGAGGVVRESGGVPVLLRVLQRQCVGAYSEDRQIAIHALYALTRQNVDNCAAIEEAGAIPVILAVAEYEAPPGNQLACSVLGALAEHSLAACEQIRSAGGIEILVGCLAKDQIGNKPAIAGCLLLVAQDDPTNRECIVRAGGIPLLVEMLSGLPNDPLRHRSMCCRTKQTFTFRLLLECQYQRTACAALTCLARHDVHNRRAIRKCDGIMKLLTLLERACEDPETYGAAIRLLHTLVLGQDPTNRLATWAGGTVILKRILRGDSDEEDLHPSAEELSHVARHFCQSHYSSSPSILEELNSASDE